MLRRIARWPRDHPIMFFAIGLLLWLPCLIAGDTTARVIASAVLIFVGVQSARDLRDAHRSSTP
jgi:hypothetical protein